VLPGNQPGNNKKTSLLGGFSIDIHDDTDVYDAGSGSLTMFTADVPRLVAAGTAAECGKAVSARSPFLLAQAGQAPVCSVR